MRAHYICYCMPLSFANIQNNVGLIFEFWSLLIKLGGKNATQQYYA
jgi:hypothetical protein